MIEGQYGLVSLAVYPTSSTCTCMCGMKAHDGIFCLFEKLYHPKHGVSHTCNEKSEEARNVEKTQEDIPAEPSKASPEAGNVEKTQEDAPAEPSKAVA